MEKEVRYEGKFRDEEAKREGEDAIGNDVIDKNRRGQYRINDDNNIRDKYEDIGNHKDIYNQKDRLNNGKGIINNGRDINDNHINDNYINDNDINDNDIINDSE
eukprot:GHVR01119893.1.p1 GENE.GHVR01119893.1~~GHVR01119893.1.p1  ORF type:complete len:104 (-),score=17.90 GHVR01119893.1:2193-2504(-)